MRWQPRIEALRRHLTMAHDSTLLTRGEWVRAVEAAIEANRHDEALQLCNLALERDDGDVELLGLRMYLRKRAHDWGGALDDADRLVLLADRPLNRLSRSGIQIRLELYDAARADLLAILSAEETPEREYVRTSAQAQLAYVELQVGDVEKALELARGLSERAKFWIDGAVLTRAWFIEEGEYILAQERGEAARTGEPDPEDGGGST